jgi:D-alanine-D-alanine ligase
VKPSNSGSSKGIGKVKTVEQLRPMIREAFEYDRRVIVEQGLPVRELETAILGNDRPRSSRVGEVMPLREWYDYEAKYTEGGMRLAAPADVSPELEEEIQTLAIRVFTVMDASGMARIDFFLDRQTGKLYLNEINTIPGFTAMSVYSKLWAATGIPYSQLVDQLIELAFDRHRTKEPAFLKAM